MACVAPQLANLSGSREGDIEGEPLFLPSALDARRRIDGCYKDMADREAQLRQAQCYDALEAIRAIQRTKRSIRAFRQKNLRGQAATTRTLQVLERLDAKTTLAVGKYRTAREALLVLRGPGAWQTDLRLLTDSDIRALDSQIFDIDIPLAKKQKLGNTGTNVRQLGSGSYQISWIWMVQGALEGMSQDDIDGHLRVEWLKSRARVMRYREEITMVTDERTFTLKSLAFEAQRWESERSPDREDLDAAGREGVIALAGRQAWIRRSLASSFQSLWATPARRPKVRTRDRSDLDVAEVSDSDDGLDSETEGVGGRPSEAISGVGDGGAEDADEEVEEAED